ncbi:FtsK/SpoIIIE domain-containing protein [Macrococcoides canis]|uniref:FtsK/SpoIIIE domain-containing protein n=1 Tax=Macrococcoides canis TaxID=1855823 RepID=UPI0022B8A6F5|nr:FtsK/SpoIIIE domain-containing protein [Macrococcus canis]WBF53987.1 cell division protein FtsK [Macrococcus canis]
MSLKEIPIFKGTKIQPYYKNLNQYIILFVLLVTSLILLYRIYQEQQLKNKEFTIMTVIDILKDKYLSLFIILGVVAGATWIILKLLRLKVIDLANMIETQGFIQRVTTTKQTEYLKIEMKHDDYRYYPTIFYKTRGKDFILHVKKDGSRFQKHYLELETIIEPMFDCELKEKRHIGRYVKYVFRPLKYKKRLIMDEKMLNKHDVEDMYNIQITNDVIWNYVKSPHALVSGVTGGGKTYFLFYMIRELVKRKAEVRLLDPKNSDLSFMSKVLGSDKVADTKGKILGQLRQAEEEMEERYAFMKSSDKYKIGKDFRIFDLPPYFVIFDEITAFTSVLDKKEFQEMNDRLTNIIMKGRQAGVFMFLTAQRPDADVIKGSVRDQLGLRVSLGNLSSEGYRMVYGQTDKEFMSVSKDDLGRGYLLIQGQHIDPVMFEAPLMEQYDFEKDVEQILIQNKVDDPECRTIII